MLLGLVMVPRLMHAQAISDAVVSRGTLAFDAKATLGAFTGVTTTVTGKLLGANSLTGVHGWVEAATKTLSTNNDHRDRDMASSLESDKYPTMRFDLDSVIAGEVQGDSTAVTLLGRFTLHGQARPVTLPGWVWTGARGARFRGAAPLNVKDYGVGGLSKMLGMLKMNEMIVVRIDVTFGER